MSIENRLYLVPSEVDRERHIQVRLDDCSTCIGRDCTRVCPAQCYVLADGRVEFNYEGCLECGSCRIACDAQAIDWKYPRGGFGIHLRYG
jgi:ferredoxin like protein